MRMSAGETTLETDPVFMRHAAKSYSNPIQCRSANAESVRRILH